MKIPRSIMYSTSRPASCTSVCPPRLRRVTLVGYGIALLSNTHSGRNAPRAPVGNRLDRVVDRRVDVLADELHGDVAAALERHVGHLLAGRLLERDGDDLVFLLRAGAGHLELVRAGRLIAAM